MKKKIIVFLAALLGAFAMPSLQAQQIPQRQNEGVNKMNSKNSQKAVLKDLNLTATQKAEMKVLQEEGRSQMQAIQNDKNLSQQDKKAKLEALREAQTVKRNAILTPEQKAKIESQMKERQANAGKNGQRIQQGRQGINSQGRRRMSPQNTQSKNWDALNLTATQKAEMKVLQEEGRSQMQAIQNDKSLSQQDKKAKLEALREAQTVKRNTILTPEQQAKWNANRQTMRGPGDRNLRSKRPLPTPTNS